MRDGSARDEVRSLEVDIHQLGPVGVRRVGQRKRGRVDAGAVEDVVDAAVKLREDLGEAAVDIVLAADVQLAGVVRLAAALVEGVCDAVEVDVGQREERAEAVQLESGCAAAGEGGVSVVLELAESGALCECYFTQCRCRRR